MPHKETESDDPLELVGMVLAGEPGELELMAECIIEEYVRLGWDEKRLMTIFRSPMFLATHRIYRQKGEPWVRELIGQVLAKWGGYKFADIRVSDAPPACAIMDEMMQPTQDGGDYGRGL